MAFQINSKKIAKNTLTLYIRQAITMFISFFTVRVTLEQLGVQDYGLNNLVGSIVSMFSFINGSMGTAVQRFYSYEIGRENNEKLKKIFGVGLFLHLTVAAITLLLIEIFAVFFLEKMSIPSERMFAAHIVFQISAATLCMGIITVPYSALLKAREMFSQTALVEIVQAFLRLGVLYLLIILPFDKLITLSLLNLLVSAAGILTFVVMARRFSESHSKPILDKPLAKEMLGFISFLLLTVLAQLLNTQGIVMLINLFFGLTINAAYAVATQVQHAVNTFLMNFKFSMVPQIMAAYGASDLKSMHRLINFGTKITFLMQLMITLPLIFSAQWILDLWLKEPPQYAAELVILTLISINISSFTYFYYQGVHASGKIATQQLWMTSTYLASILFIFLLFKMGFSFYTALFVNMGVGILQCGVNLFYAKKRFDYPLQHFFKKILGQSILIAVVSIIIMKSGFSLTDNNLIKFIYSMGIDLLIIPFIGFYLLFEKNERSQVIDFAKKIMHQK
jgi:O-antigen/teichoic acid export membrane protein